MAILKIKAKINEIERRKSTDKIINTKISKYYTSGRQTKEKRTLFVSYNSTAIFIATFGYLDCNSVVNY